MPAQLVSAQSGPQSSQEASASARAMAAFAVTLVIAGAGLAWALLAASRGAVAAVAAGGGAAAVVVVAAVTTAVYYAVAMRQAGTMAAAREREARRLAEEFAGLARDTLPTVAQRVRDGATPDEVFGGMPRPDSEAVRALLTTVHRLLGGVMEGATAARDEAEDAAKTARGEASTASQRAAAAAADLSGIKEEISHLATETVPMVIGQMRAGEPRDMVLAEVRQRASPVLGGLLETVVTEVAAAERRGASAMAACANAAARVQAQTTRMLAELREMEQRYGEDKVFADLMGLDHRVSQMGRLADSIALLSGGRTGRRWTRPIPMESILRGAMGRIDAYQRVRLNSSTTAAIAGYAAEGVMHALAELLDNAAAFSAHGSAVHVYVEEEDAGLVVTIEDSGLGMRRRERDRAEQVVSQPLDLATLPGTRLGLAVVGRVAARYGLTVSFRPSSRGGTGVVVMIPRPLLSQPKGAIGAGPGWTPPAGGDAERGDAVMPARGGQVSDTSADPDLDEDTGGDADFENLPVRPRGRTLQDAPQSALGTRMAGPRTDAAAVPYPAGPVDTTIRPASDAGSRFAAFRQAGERARDTSGSGPLPVRRPEAGGINAGSPDAGSEHDGSEGQA
jgi:signal transduction histidine kinase